MKFEDIYIGSRANLKHQVTQQDIEKFVDLSGDDNKLHVDKEFAAKTSFKKPVVHGMIGASFISTIIGTKLPGDGALWFSQTLEFLLPVRVGDWLEVNAEVIKKNERERIIELKVEIYNQNRQVVTKGISKVKVVELQEQQLQEEKTGGNGQKVALIIGATGGIGEAIALQLAEDGMDIIIHYRNNREKANSLKNKIEQFSQKGYLVEGDIYDEQDLNSIVEKSIRHYTRIDVLINCAAAPIPTIKWSELDWNDFMKQFELNIKSNLLLIQKVAPYMIENKKGKIITIGSIVSDKPSISWVHYTTAKAALEGFTKSMALELAPKGINVNMVSPSLVNTDLTSDIPEKVKMITASQTPLRRLAQTSDIAGAVSFLASEKSDFLSGEIIRLNGGQLMI